MSSAFYAFLLGAFALCTPTHASTVTLNPESVTSYYYLSNLPHLSRSFLENPRLGDSNRHVMVFDLLGVSGEIVGATLQVEEGLGTQVSVGTSRTYSVWDVTSPINTLAQNNTGNDAISIYSDIGTGTLYGTSTFNVKPTNGANPLPSPGVSVDLSGGLVDLNAALGGMIALGEGVSPDV